jgi:hypothetical protein
MIPFDKNTLDRWMSDYEEFNYEFRTFCNMHFKVHGIQVDFVPNVTKQIHNQWTQDHQYWLDQETDERTQALSHVKICALLLANLVSEPFLGNFYDHEYQEDVPYVFRGTDAQKAAARQDLIDGREHVLSLDFVILIIDWYERNRIDRATLFRQPMTEDMRHDLINYLLSGKVEKKALYLILKALYLRPHGAGKAN